MELYHLRTFVAVAEEKHLTRAAERLFTSQPAISAHIKALEETLGVTLFDRTPKGMRLTRVGEELLPRARQALAAASAVMQHAKGLQDELIGSVRIGLNTDARFLRLTALQAALAASFPRLEVSMLTGSTGTNVPAVRVGKLDGAFVTGEIDDPTLSVCYLCDEPLIVAAPTAFREQITSTDVAALARLPWVFTSPDCSHYRAMRVLFEAHCCEPVRTLIANQEDALVEMIRAGVGLGIVRKGVLSADDPQAYELPVALAPAPLQFVHLKKRDNDPVIRAVVQALCTVWDIDTPLDQVREAG